jgi:hypothetical protein
MRLATMLLVLLAVTPAGKRQRPARVLVNGQTLTSVQPTLKLTGPFTCADNQLSSSTECACPNTGILTQGVVQLTPSKSGQLDVVAPWVTLNSIIVCTPVATGTVPISVSVIPDSVKPGLGFSIAVTAPQVTVGAFNIGCIGAVPQ